MGAVSKEDMESIKTQTENGLLLLEKVLKKNPCSKDFCMEYGRLREKKKNLLQKYMDGIVSDSDYKLASEMLTQQINQMTEQEKRNDTVKPGQRLFCYPSVSVFRRRSGSRPSGGGTKHAV